VCLFLLWLLRMKVLRSLLTVLKVLRYDRCYADSRLKKLAFAIDDVFPGALKAFHGAACTQWVWCNSCE
jgi:hypothetical protein